MVGCAAAIRTSRVRLMMTAVVPCEHRSETVALTIQVGEQDAVSVVVVGGELDLATAPELAAAVEERVVAEDRRLLIDLSGLTFCDSTGLATFVRLRTLLLGKGALALAAPLPAVRRVVAITGLPDCLGLHSTREGPHRRPAP